jgi:hypothetical protein
MRNSPKQSIKSSKKAFSQNRARQKRSFLSNQLSFESNLVSSESMHVLHEFESFIEIN